MDPAQRDIERGIELFRELVRESPALRAELDRSLAAFPKPAPGARSATLRARERRHLEWFLFERPSEHLGGPPGELLRAAWLERSGPADLALVGVLSASRAGAFVVTEVTPDEGLWMRDLFGAGEMAIRERSTGDQIAAGDLLVGRIYPTEDDVHVLSWAAASFRNRPLVEALSEDVERLRARRRGVLRIEQIELERIFFDPGKPPAVEPAAHDVDEEAIRELVERAGISREDARSALAVLNDALQHPQAGGNPVTELLNRMAFETECDLDATREILLATWNARHNGLKAPAPEVVETRPEEEDAPDVRNALQAFDEGRAAGRDLEELFGQLESELGITDDVTPEDLAPAPDFPGVIGAMVEEYVWDIGRTDTEQAECDRRGLAPFVRYTAPIGVFESLGKTELVDYAARWLWDDSDIAERSELELCLTSLARFCRWSEERQEHGLWSPFRAAWQTVFDALPRMVEARQGLASKPKTPNAGTYRLVSVTNDGALVLLDRSGRQREGRAPHRVLEYLEPEDLVATTEEADRLVVTGVYPSALAELLETRD